MSDMSLPPDAPKAPVKKSASRPLLMFLALIAPLPLLISILDLWLNNSDAGMALKETPFRLIAQIANGYGEPPLWAVALCLLPSVLILMVLARTLAARVLSVLALLFFAAGEIIVFSQMTGG
jgi:hypothetical protein